MASSSAASSTNSHACVSRLYQGIIDEVIENMRESFLDEGIDESVLADLKQTWDTKLNQTGATFTDLTTSMGPDRRLMPGGLSQVHPQFAAYHATSKLEQFAGSGDRQKVVKPQPVIYPIAIQASTGQMTSVIRPPQSIRAVPHLPTGVLAAPGGQTLYLRSSDGKIIQTTAAAALGQRGASGMASALAAAQQQHQQQQNTISLSQIREGYGVSGTGLPTASVVQFPGGVMLPTKSAAKSQPSQLDGPAVDLSDFGDESPAGTSSTSDPKKTSHVPAILAQLDGPVQPGQMSDDDSEDEFIEDDDPADEMADSAAAEEGEPLNSDDDIKDSDEDNPTDTFDADNVMVCQYDKITRTRNKWKFFLKDGIMNLKGRDYVFQKSTGEAEF